MSTEVVLSVNVTDAFCHLMLVGLASILEDEALSDGTRRVCRIRWDGYQRAIIVTSDGLTIADMAAVVGRHVRRWANAEWLTHKGVYASDDLNASDNKKPATMSPRLGIPTKSGWERLQHDREEIINSMQTNGDRRYFGALGQPSYWSGRSKEKDSGASRWEMVNRANGRDFIATRLCELAQKIENCSDEDICQRLSGKRIKDEIGEKDKNRMSLVATGLHKPGVTDNVRAWCALIGVASFPQMVSNTPYHDSSAAMFVLDKGGKRCFAVLPIFDHYWTLSKYRAIVRSAQLAEYGIGIVDNDISPTSHELFSLDGAQWLAEKQVLGCVIFNQQSSLVKNPELWLGTGRLFPIPTITE